MDAPKRDASRYMISAVEPEDIADVLRLYAGIFCQSEPLTCWLGFPEERIIAIARALYLRPGDRPQQRGVWLKATMEGDATGPAAFLVASDIRDQDPAEPPEGLTARELAKVPPLEGFLKELRRPLERQYSPVKGECLHISAIGVASGYQGLGIATRLLGEALEQARTRGYRLAASECTGPASLQCHRKCGFKSIHSVEYRTFEFEGARPFANIDGVCHLVLKELS